MYLPEQTSDRYNPVILDTFSNRQKPIAVQIKYSTDELVHMITTNNLVAVFTYLVTNGHVDAAMPPNVDSISYAIQEQAGRLSPEAFLNWLDDLMDVPIDQNRVYASELTAIRQSTGKSPARFMVDQIRNTIPQESGSLTFMNGVIRPNWVSWLIIGLALIGLLCVLRFAGRVLGRVTG